MLAVIPRGQMDCSSLFESARGSNYPRHLSISPGCGVGLLSRWGLPAWVQVPLPLPFVRVPLPPPFVRVPLPPPFVRVPLPPPFVWVGVGAGGCGVGLLSRWGLPAWVRFPLPPPFVRVPLPPPFARVPLPPPFVRVPRPPPFVRVPLPPPFVHDIRSCVQSCILPHLK